MAKRQITKGSTSEVWTIFIQDSASTVGAGKTGLAYNTASLTCYYKRNKATAAAAVTLASITTLGTFVSGGFKEIDATNMPGFYEFHPPDAALASGAESVAFQLKGASGMAMLPLEVELTATNNQDAVRMGLTALPNAAAEAAGGLFTRGTGAGQINQDANGRINVNLLAILGTTLTETVGGYLSAGFKKLLDIATPVFTLASINQTGDGYARIGANGAGLTALGDTRLANLDATIASRATQTSVDDLTTDVSDVQTSIDYLLLTTEDGGGGIPRFTADALEQAPSGLDAAGIRTAVGLATANLDTQLGAIVGDTNELQTDWTNGGRLDLLIDLIRAVTDKVDTAFELDGVVYRLTTNALEQAPTGGSAPTVIEIRQEMDTNSTKLTDMKAKTDQLAFTSGNVHSRVMTFEPESLTTAAILMDGSPTAFNPLETTDLEAAAEVGAGAALASYGPATPAQVKAQVVAALVDDLYNELSGEPDANSTIVEKLTWLFMFAKNTQESDDSEHRLYANDGTTIVATSAHSDDETTYRTEKWA
jgi:hypothetical protein